MTVSVRIGAVEWEGGFLLCGFKMTIYCRWTGVMVVYGAISSLGKGAWIGVLCCEKMMVRLP